MMAVSSSVDTKGHNGHAEVHAPRPRKPTRIDLLKPQMAEEAFNKDGTLKEPGSGVSRYCGTTTLENAWLT
jgi:sterol O-acyltransferase